MNNTKHSKHVFTTLIVVILCVIAIFLFGVAKKAKISDVESGVIQTENGNGISYISGDMDYSFTLPSDFTFSTLSNDDGSETALFVGSTATRNFQIYVSVYESNEPVTPQAILRDIPDLLVEKSETIAIDGAQGVTFISGSKESELRTREVWFSYGGKLYQISTYKEFDDQMVDILSTWKWQ
jgi:hypothetical protein